MSYIGDKVMERKWIRLASFGALVVGAVALVVWAEAKEETVTLDQVPAAAREALTKAAGDAKITKIEKDEEDGVAVYEATFVVDGKKKEAKVTADGKAVKDDDEGDEEKDKEESIKADEVPAKARETLVKLAGDAKITGFSKETEDGVVAYEAEWTVKDRAHSASVTADGALISAEEVMDPNAVPEAVSKAAAKHFPAGAKLTFEKETKVSYEVTCKVDGKEKKLELSPGGKVEEDEGDEDDQKGEKDKDDDKNEK